MTELNLEHKYFFTGSILYYQIMFIYYKRLDALVSVDLNICPRCRQYFCFLQRNQPTIYVNSRSVKKIQERLIPYFSISMRYKFK